MSFRALVIGLVISGVCVESAQAYSCKDLVRDVNTKTLSKLELNGFSSLEEKIKAMAISTFDAFPRRVAKRSYEEYKAEGKLVDPYSVSLLTYDSLVKARNVAAQIFDGYVNAEGSFVGAAVSQCRQPEMEVHVVFELLIVSAQKAIQENNLK